MAPGDQCWIDLWVPAGDALWVDDIIEGAFWAGEVWADAAEASGWTGVESHTGSLDRTPLSDLVCFAGRGPGEVFVGHQKLVGISQRRTRDWIRLQTMAYSRWQPEDLIDVLATSPEHRRVLVDELADVAIAWGEPGSVIAANVVERLP